jgi:glutathione synthase/RimK-type ligase-like ATP-grasp enzyme
MGPPRYIVVANPDSLRWQAYAPELTAFWASVGVEPEVEVVSWRDVIARDGNVDDLAAFDRPALVRLESPGRDWQVAQHLLAAGSRECGEEETIWLTLPYDKGRLVRPGLFYAGFCRVLNGLHRAFARRPHLTLCADPLEVAEMFDKNATSARLARAGVPVPPSLVSPGTPEELLAALQAAHYPTAYVKLNTGSSASAIAVVRAMEESPWAISSIVRLRGGMYSTRRLCRHEDEDLKAVLGFLIEEGVCVQQGIRMAQIDGQNFDVRVVVIHGKPAFTVFRLSPAPMTNLHLGGRRGDVRACRAAIPTRAWLDGLDHCVETARLYRSAAVGIDLLFESGYRHHFVLEVNAFGDFFPNLTDEQGRSVYRVEIEATARAKGLLPSH